MSNETIRTIARQLAGAKRVLFITGAGLSAESGMPTYRGVGGLYENCETEDGMPIEEALCGSMFRRDPKLCWKYIMRLGRACEGVEPNRGHEIIAELEERFRVWVLTQNVDGLHHRAGSTNVIDIHGTASVLYCTSCDWNDHVESYQGLADLPTCPSCTSVIRPDVVLFDEMLDDGKCAALGNQLELGFDAVFSVGTTSVFPYITRPIMLHRGRALTVEINPGDTLVSEMVDHRLRMGAGEALQGILDALKEEG